MASARNGDSERSITPKFTKALAGLQPAKVPSGRTWIFVNEDQLNDQIGELVEIPPQNAGVILIENTWKAGLRPYHKQRLALNWANQRHFALEQAKRGVYVRYLFAKVPYREVLAHAAAELGAEQILCMTPAERELRADILPLVRSKVLLLSRHDGWLTSHDDFLDSQKGPPWRMDMFYRHVRRKSGVLMEGKKGDQFVGGKLSFDVENRLSWSGPPHGPAAPKVPTFTPDAITAEVCDLVESAFAHHPGVLQRDSLPASAADAKRLWQWALKHCMEHFGPYEDAMSAKHRNLFHTRVSALMNLHRLLPRDVVRDAEVAELPLESKEGFIRQILGWREFVRHVHFATDGFRTIGERVVPSQSVPGDGGFARWAGHEWPGTADSESARQVDVSSATPAELGSSTPLPPAFWRAGSGMNCLDTVVTSVWEEAYSHHITRLMVLGNLATLLDVNPRELTDWFWVAYIDAWDWVVEPNVLGMATFATGQTMTTKPYVAGAAYINKMSDYCGDCRFDPQTTCPIKSLYWAFLQRHEPKLKGNPRMMMPMRSLAKRSQEQKASDARIFATTVQLLVAGEPLTVKAYGQSVTEPMVTQPKRKGVSS